MAINVYKVIYHYESGNRRTGEMIDRQDHIAASVGDPATLTTVLNNNGRAAPTGSVIVFDSISNAGPGPEHADLGRGSKHGWEF